MRHCATNTDAFRAHGVMLVPAAVTVPRLAFTDIEDHDTSRLPALDRGLHRQREPEPPVEVDAAHDRLERAGQPVGAELASTRVAA
jgi:hypothetical protein